jgi:phosphomannomutase
MFQSKFMSIPKHIFKMYDIRGFSEKEITEELAYNIGKAFGSMLIRENDGKVVSVAVGRDMRETSPKYQVAVVRGLKEVGASVVDIGLVSTPAFYFGVSHTQANGGLMVTASHNPGSYNGFKMTRANAVPVSGDTGIKDLVDIIESENYESLEEGIEEKVEGVPELAARAEFEFAGTDPVKQMSVVIDTANGMGAQYMDQLLKLINVKANKMFWEFDGSFPNHEADPFKPENIKFLQDKVLETGADLGITTDGDGDRIFFVDNKGELVEPAIIRGLLAQIVLRDNPGATICYDIRPGKITRDMIVEAGGKPSVTRVGHSLIKEQMRKEGAAFGGESSGHFFYKFDTGTYEGPVTVATQILQEITRQEKTMAEIADPLRKYSHSGEINFMVDDKDKMIEKLKSEFSDGELSEIDGITITYEDYWFNVRGSNTESKLRLNLEAVDQETMEKNRDKIIALIEAK